jgi:putative ABC transport system permease protein
MARLLSDLRFALRQILRSPGFAITAVVTLALAIGANTAIFTLLNQALLRALPVIDPSRLVVLSFSGSAEGHIHSEGGDTPGHNHYFSYPMYRDLRDNNKVFSGLIAAAAAPAGVSWNNQAQQVDVEMVSGNYFPTLGVQAAVGRLLLPGDETAPNANPVAVLSYDFWRTHLAQAPVAGKTLLVNGYPFTIAGVAAPGFHSMVWGRRPDLYVPMTMQAVIEPEWSYLNDHRAYWLNIVGRLRADETLPHASASLSSLWDSLRSKEFALQRDQSAKAREKFVSRSHLNLDAGANGFSPYRGELRTPLLIMMAMVLLVMAMAVVNVAGLLLVRAAGRVREFSMRFALGATKRQILRQLLAEGLLLGISSAVLGLFLAPQALKALITWMAGRNPDSAFSATLDWRVLLFTVASALTASLLFSLAPALQFWNPRLVEALKQQAGTGSGEALRFRRTCVALQIGFSLLLIVGAGVFVRTIQNLRNVNPGFATDHLLTFGLAPEHAGYPSNQIVPVEQRALEALAALPGVRGAGATNDAELEDDNVTGDVTVAGYTAKPDEDLNVELPWISDNYLQTLGVPLVAGRYFSPSDSATATKVIIVNETFARHYFGSPQNALGHHVSRPERPETDAAIVGVVRDARHTTVRDPAMPTAYRPFVQGEKPVSLNFYIRTWQPPDAAAGSIRAAITNIDRKLIVHDLTTLSTQIDDTIANERTIALLASTFGVLATILAGIGLYGILAYSTAQRTREIGIRMALGAQRWEVVRLILREVLALAGVAVAVAIPVAIFATRALRSQLFNVSSIDAAIYAAAIAIIVFTAALAGLIPARRAASIDPARALRTDT